MNAIEEKCIKIVQNKLIMSKWGDALYNFLGVRRFTRAFLMSLLRARASSIAPLFCSDLQTSNKRETFVKVSLANFNECKQTVFSSK